MGLLNFLGFKRENKKLIPDPLTYTIVLANDVITKENIEEYRKKEKECNYGKEKRRNN